MQFQYMLGFSLLGFVTWLKHVLIAFGPLGSFTFVISFAYVAELSTAKTRINLQILTQDIQVSSS